MSQNVIVCREALHVLKSTVNGTSGNLDLIEVITCRKEILDQEVQQTTTLLLDSKKNFWDSQSQMCMCNLIAQCLMKLRCYNLVDLSVPTIFHSDVLPQVDMIWPPGALSFVRLVLRGGGGWVTTLFDCNALDRTLSLSFWSLTTIFLVFLVQKFTSVYSLACGTVWRKYNKPLTD